MVKVDGSIEKSNVVNYMAIIVCIDVTIIFFIIFSMV